MSRIPQASNSRTSSKPKPPTTSTSSSTSGSTPRSRTISTPSKPRAKTPGLTPTPTLRTQASLKNLKPSRSPALQPPPLPDEIYSPKPQLSIREQIALKRAEAKKAESRIEGSIESRTLENTLPVANKPQEEEEVVDLGRWTIKETIERGRSSGIINLVSRQLPCLPSALFEIHLGIKPGPLKLVQEKPSLTTASLPDSSRRKADSNAPTWYEAQDLQILKAWSNEIVELQPELSMFGSLKVVDLRNNKLTTLPDSFADLTALTFLDLSHNSLRSLPANIFTLPDLSTLNISYNELTVLPFHAPFSEGPNPLARTVDPRGDWFSQSIVRATSPLPRLSILDVSHNHLSAATIDHARGSLPGALTKLDFSANPLGRCLSLLRGLSTLARLKELRFERAEIGDDAFPVDLFPPLSTALSVPPFPALKVLDLGETQVNLPVIEAALTTLTVKQKLDFDITLEEPRDGVLRVILGKKIMKEGWELEVEKRAKKTRVIPQEPHNAGTKASVSKPVHAKEAWEIEAEQGLLTEGAKRRERALAATATSSGPAGVGRYASASSKPAPKTIEKESWEIEAEQGLLTAGAKRRARAQAAAAAAAATPNIVPSVSGAIIPSASVTSSPPSTSSAFLHYYFSNDRSLALPASALPAKAAHARSFSLAPVLSVAKTAGSQAVSSRTPKTADDFALAIPTPTLPLSVIIFQPFAQTLKVLSLVGRKMDPSFSLPVRPPDTDLLPCLEELKIENCNLSDNVPVSRATGDVDSLASSRTSEPLLPLLASLFPSLRTLDLSYNNLTSAALTKDALATLILASDTESGDSARERRGLKHFRLRGNRFTELNGFEDFAERFKGNRELLGWRLEELDLRDNEIGKLPSNLGLLPLDVFLVDGNVFRVPPRRVWEREGTKGLLSWLRGRLE